MPMFTWLRERRLVRAVVRGDVEEAARLLGKGAGSNTRDESGRTPLMHAVEARQLSAVTLLLSKGGDPNIPLPDGAMLLFEVSNMGDMEATRALVTAGARLWLEGEADIGRRTKSYFEHSKPIYSAMKEAIEGGQERRITSLLMAGAGEACLDHAAVEGEASCVRVLLAQGVDPSMRLRGGETALSRAAANGHSSVMRVLVEAGADVEAESSHALRVALVKRNQSAISELLSMGANPAAVADVALSYLADVRKTGWSKTAGLLMRGLAEREVSADRGAALLVLAAEVDDQITIARLLEAGVNVEARDSEGMTALLIASRKGEDDTVRALRKAGADLEAVGKEGMRALMLAAQHGLTTTVGLLLELGADPWARSEGGATAVELALRGNKFDLARRIAKGRTEGGSQREEAETILLPALAYWKGLIQVLRKAVRNQNFNAVQALAMIRMICAGLETAVTGCNAVREEAHELGLLPTGGAALGMEFRAPSKDVMTPEDLPWVFGHLDIAEGAIVRLGRAIGQGSRLLDVERSVDIGGAESGVVKLASGVVAVGGPGDSMSSAVIIKGALNPVKGVVAEYEYLIKVCEPLHTARLAGPPVEKDWRVFDKIVVTHTDGRQTDFFFDITEFFGRLSSDELRDMMRSKRA